MAIITGSSTIDWSGQSLELIKVQKDLNDFIARFDQMVTEFENETITFNSNPNSTTFFSVTLSTQERVVIKGSGFNGNDPVINSFQFSDPSTGEVTSLSGRIALHIDINNIATFTGDIRVDSLTSSKPNSPAETIIGNIVIDPTTGDISGSITQLKETLGSSQVIMKGNLVASGNLNIADNVSVGGNVTEISVLSGTNKILMTDLNVAYSTLSSVTNCDDLFSLVGNQLGGDDTITYDSKAGIELFGGAGDDRITGGTGSDTLHGGADDDILVGGKGHDTIDGDLGDDRITMLVTAGDEDTIDAGADSDTLVLSGVVPGNHQVVVDLSKGDQVISIGGVDDALTQSNFENLDASGISSFLKATGSDDNNLIIGSNGDDSITGGAGNDDLRGGLGHDWLAGGAGNDTLDGGASCDYMIGGDGNDTYVVDDIDDSIIELPGGGTDTVKSNRSVDLNLSSFASIENVLLTGTVAVNATGNSSDNVLTGNSAANILVGGVGNDTLTGDIGNDTLVGGSGDDSLNGGAGNDTYRYGTTFFDPEGNDTITDGAGNDLIIMNGLDLSGGSFLQSGNDFEALGTNVDITIKDQYAGNRIESFQFTGGASMYGYALGGTPYLLNTDASHNGGLQNDLIAGTSGDDILNGNGGNDLLFGNGGNDILNGGAGNDLLVANGNGSSEINGGDGNDTILGGSGPVTGGAGDDRIFWDITNSLGSINAGTGNDTLMLVGLGDVVIDLSQADQVGTIGGVADGATQGDFENLDASGLISLLPPGTPPPPFPIPGLTSSVNVTGSDAANVLVGSVGNDILNAGAGNDTLAGGAGDDQLDGGAGNDMYRYDASITIVPGPPGIPPLIFDWGKDSISDSGGTDLLIMNGLDLSGWNFERVGTDLVGSAFLTSGVTIKNQYAGANKVESLKFDAGASMYGFALGSTPYLLNTAETGSPQNDLIAGTSIGETLNGNGGNDLLFGNGGNDTLNGGTGNDLLVGGDDNDTLDGSVGNDMLAGGLGEDNVIGGAGDDRILLDVTSGNVDILNAGLGTDTLLLSGVVDGDGVAVVNLASLTDQVTRIGTVDPELLAQINFENLDASGLGGSVNATGSAGANIIIGSAFNDTLKGGAGNDRLDGGEGNDVMDGEAGNDTYVVDSSSDTASETGIGIAGGLDLVQSSALSFTLGTNVENLTLLGTADSNGTGNSLNNILTGNSGNNSLDGGAGADKMAGGLGNDTYRVDAVGDVVTEALNAGTDNVISSVTYTLGANVENLQLISGANINGTGNTLANVLTGSNGDNLLSGLGGNDILRGGHGNDTLNGGTGNDTYLFDLGDGMDVIQDNSGCFDKVVLDGGINHQDLVISRQANDLRIAIHGSNDQITVKNWFVGTTNQTEIIQTGDGQVLLNTQVQQLIDAMAQFTADNNGVTWDQAAGGAGDQAQFQGILAASWQA